MTDQPPADLAAAGRRLWIEVLDRYELDPDEREILKEAARTADELETLRAALATAPATVEGSTGQPRAHPLFDELRRHRDALTRLLAALRLPDEAELSVSDKARAAASARWQGTRRGA